MAVLLIPLGLSLSWFCFDHVNPSQRLHKPFIVHPTIQLSMKNPVFIVILHDATTTEDDNKQS